MTLRFPELHPIPQPKDYLAAYEMYDAEMGDGGAWLSVMKRAAAARESRIISAENITMISYGFALEPRDDSMRPIDQMYRRNHAFLQGFFHQFGPISTLYEDKVTLPNLLEVATDIEAAQHFEAIEEYGARVRMRQEYVEAMGEYGLSLAGDEAMKIIEKWSMDVYPPSSDATYEFEHGIPDSEELRRVFVVGNGVMMLCGLRCQEAINNAAITKVGENIDFDEEADLFLFKDPGESA